MGIEPMSEDFDRTASTSLVCLVLEAKIESRQNSLLFGPIALSDLFEPKKSPISFG